jgi:hypothetical protein
MVMAEARAQAATIQSHKINIDIMLDIVQEHQKASF